MTSENQPSSNRDSLRELIQDLDDLSYNYRRRVSNKDGGDGDTGKDRNWDLTAKELIQDLDNVADNYRRRFLNLDGGDTGKDSFTNIVTFGRLIEDLDDLAQRYRRRFTNLDGGDGDGDTGK